ncbi:MAG: MarC family protein [Pseudomonadota bacterium]
MTLSQVAVLLFLVTDPFGNLPLVLSILQKLENAAFRRVVLRETVIAFMILTAFAWNGDRLLSYLNVSQDSLNVAGGVILLIISLNMVFGQTLEIFDDRYADDPLLVPIAIPAIAGPAALTTVMLLSNQRQIPFTMLLGALGLVFLVNLGTFLLGRHLGAWLGPRGLSAAEKFMGLLLNLVSVDMIMTGIKRFFA